MASTQVRFTPEFLPFPTTESPQLFSDHGVHPKEWEIYLDISAFCCRDVARNAPNSHFQWTPWSEKSRGDSKRGTCVDTNGENR